MKKDIDDALDHENNLQHDTNEEPILYVNSEEIEETEHEENTQNDNNEKPVTFTDDSDE